MIYIPYHGSCEQRSYRKENDNIWSSCMVELRRQSKTLAFLRLLASDVRRSLMGIGMVSALAIPINPLRLASKIPDAVRNWWRAGYCSLEWGCLL